jgi:S1-C subfamily serine protease
MKLSIASVLFVCLLLLLAVPTRVGAQLSMELHNSIVRIVCPEPAEKGGKGLNVFEIHLSSGDTINCADGSRGTGFVITNDGVIATNNHVVAPDPLKDTPQPLVMVMQKAGDRFILHKAAVLWQSPNADLAIIQAPTLHAVPLPIQFDETKSTPSEEVYSMGFPGITDLAEEDLKVSGEVRRNIVRNKTNRQIKEKEKEQNRKLTQAEVDAIAKDVAAIQTPPQVDWMQFVAAMNAVLMRADDTATVWDVTEATAEKNLRADYFKPTVTKGNIERMAKIRGFLGVTHPDVSMIQHSCAIKHGNSGGPLFNGGGQVIGVVGRGVHQTASGDHEEIKWATAAGELKEWLESHKIAYIPAGEWHKATDPVKIIEQLPATIIEKPMQTIVERLPAKMIIAIALAVAVAIAVAIFGFMKAREAPSVTKLLRDPRMAKALGAAPVEALANDEVRLRRTPDAPRSAGATWQLAGRTPKGDRVRVELTDAMFASNDFRLILGRTPELCHVVIDDDSISKQHAHLRKDGDRFMVADRNSSNHTMLNGQIKVNVFNEVPIKEGDTLTLGQVRLDFSKL